MSQRSLERSDLERELGALGAAIDWPPTPDVAAAVRLRLTERVATPRRLRLGALLRPRLTRPRLTRPRLTRPLLLALLLLALAVAVATAVALGLPRLRITFTSDPLPTPNVPAATTPAASPSASSLPGSDLGLGTPVTLEQAEARFGVPLLLPAVPGRAGPDATYVTLLRGSTIVTLIWGAGPDLPPLRAGSDVGLLVTVLRATVDEGLLQKLVPVGTTVERISVGPYRGFWISGDEHILWFRRPDGAVIETPIRLVGDTLALEIDGRVVRLEVAGGREAAVELAATLRER